MPVAVSATASRGEIAPRGRPCSACCFPKVSPCDQPLEAYLSAVVSQGGVET
jgi:hypothetical protein